MNSLWVPEDWELSSPSQLLKMEKKIPPRPKEKKWRRKSGEKISKGGNSYPSTEGSRAEVMVTFFDGSRFEELTVVTVGTFGTVFAVVSVLFPVVILVVVFVMLFPCVDSTFFFVLVSAFFVTLDFVILEGEGE